MKAKLVQESLNSYLKEASYFQEPNSSFYDYFMEQLDTHNPEEVLLGELFTKFKRYFDILDQILADFKIGISSLDENFTMTDGIYDMDPHDPQSVKEELIEYVVSIIDAIEAGDYNGELEHLNLPELDWNKGPDMSKYRSLLGPIYK